MNIYLIQQNTVFQGDYVWIEPVSGRDFDVAIGAKVFSAEGRKIQVRDDDGKVKLSLRPICLRIERHCFLTIYMK